MKLKDKSFYEENKKFFNKHFNHMWKEIAGRSYIGSCSYLYKKLNPINYQDFYDKYTNYYQKNGIDDLTLRGSHYYGRSEEQLMKLTARYQSMCEMVDYEIAKLKTTEDYYHDIVNHIIIETFDGHYIERYVSDLIKSTGKFIVNETEGNLDTICGVDLIVKSKKTNEISNFIQIKPITTFIGYKNKSLIKDRINFYNKQTELDDYLISIGKGNERKNIEYMCYDINTLGQDIPNFLTIGNKTRFRINELCDLEGRPLLKQKDFLFKKL